MTDNPIDSRGAESEFRQLTSPAGIRERCEALYALGTAGKLAHFTIDETRLQPIADLVIGVTREAYPDVARIPYHSRWRHFAVGGVDRTAKFEASIADLSPEDRLAARAELAITSVLLDAGAGERWSFREPGGGGYARSEGLALASYHLFVAGGFSSDPTGAPFRADAAALERMSTDRLGKAFQVTPENPLVGLPGRAAVLRRLGELVRTRHDLFGGDPPRLGRLVTPLVAEAAAAGGRLPARAVFARVLEAYRAIAPGRLTVGDKPLGDVFQHSEHGKVPFHKLSQWLTYSLVEPLLAEGIEVVDLDELTGLAEYRNGGLFVDGGAIVPKQPGVLKETHDVGSDVVIEWRALTVALLDRVAERMRTELGLSREALPLAKVLEGGTWRAGRKLAKERRPAAAPPIRVRSDGTVF